MQIALDLRTEIEAHLESLALKEQKPATLYAVMDYILSMGGKRIRPILVLLAYQTVSGKSPKEAMDLAVAMEIFHNFTLLHDDIMDAAPVRRGKKTAHLVWNENTAILAGDALFAYSMGLVVRNFPEHAAKLTAAYAKISLEVCEGQMEDMDMADETDVSIERYIEMIRKKTAVLLGGCLQVGAIAGGASDELAEELYQFGESLGIGFQLQDDLMDTFPPEGFGKQVGGDIIENKRTYLLLKAFQLADQPQRQRLEQLMAQNDESEQKVKGVVQLFQELDIPEHTQNISKSYFKQAHQIGLRLQESCNFAPIQNYLERIANRQK